MGALLEFVVSVGGFATLLLVGIVWLILTTGRSRARVWLTTLTIAYTLAATYGLARLASLPLVAGYHPFTRADVSGRAVNAVVVLGGGALTVRGRDRTAGVLTSTTAARVLEASRVYGELGSPWVISSGGSGTRPDSVPEAVVIRDLLERLGVPASKILLELRSTQTRDEALFVSQMLRSLGADPFVLVTSDIHMRRSLATFRALGLDPIPAVTSESLDPRARWMAVVPTSTGLQLTAHVVHEYVALAYYYVRGWL